MVKLDDSAKEVIEAILKRGNDAVVRRKKDGFIILEESKKIKYDACSIGSEERQ